MKRAVIAIVALFLVGGGYWIWRSKSTPSGLMVDEQALAPQGAEAKVNQFLEERGWVLPANVERANLQGDSETDTGVSTRETQGAGTLITVMADLPDLSEGAYYAWYARDENWVRLGKLSAAKGGYLLETTVPAAKELISEITISSEVTPGTSPASVILRGSFGK